MPYMFNTKTVNFEEINSIHLIGIGGIGISGLARILKYQGKTISGSDQSASHLTDSLENEGIKFYPQQLAENLSEKPELIVYSAAVPENNPELAAAIQQKIPTISYPEAVGILTKNFRTISVCGTHGKTTTTALASLALTANQCDPTVIVGALLKEFDNKNERVGKSDWFILESCEYHRHFLNYHPEIIILNNVEPDHLDYFSDAEDYFSAFQQFIDQLKPNGVIIANGDDLNIQKLIKNNPTKQFITFGQNSTNDYQIDDHKILKNGELLTTLNLSVPGQHNIYNSAAVVALTEYLKSDLATSVKALESFTGTSRRFEIKGKINQKTTIIDDYAHHPTEIKATLQACREKYGDNAKLLVIFQPHQYSRTKKLLKDFTSCFNLADQLIIPNIYAARDSQEDKDSISVDTLVQKINRQNPSSIPFAMNGKDLNYTLEITKQLAGHFDVILTMGAGDITKLSDQLLN
jgi:UDP-N-acetylmuramate--alanine ligase